MPYHYVLRKKRNGEAVGLFPCSNYKLVLHEKRPYFLSPKYCGNTGGSVWCEEITEAQFETYRDLAHLPVEDLWVLAVDMS